jgi:hypothetical protein
MPGHGHCGPKDNSKKPQEDKHQRDRMRDDFNQPTSGSQEDCCRSETDKQRKLGANEGAKISRAFSITVDGHERDHIHGVGVMQSADVTRYQHRRGLPHNMTDRISIQPESDLRPKTLNRME